MKTSTMVLLASLTMGANAFGATVTLSPGDDIQQAVDTNPQGTTFMLEPGLYRIQSVKPKTADAFIGADGANGAVLDGANLLSQFDRDGTLYVARNQPIDPDTQVHGVCRKGFPRCKYPQDLYFDGVPLIAVAKRSKVKPGTFFYDYDAEAVTFADDPAGHTVELSYRPFAFGGKVQSITIQHLTIENYACADQQGAIGDQGEGKTWEIMDNEVRWNHGVGIAIPHGSEVRDNFVHHNGELGLGAGAGSGTLEGNEIAFNVWNGTDCTWECGGVKWAQVTEWFVLDNYVHDNQGDGLWADIGSRQMLFRGNRIENNLYAGISYEISSNAVIDGNSFAGNGAATFGWGWQGQIQIQNSSGVEAENNTLVLDPAKGGNGIIIIQQNRGRAHMPEGNKIHDNAVTLQGGEGALAGWFADYKPGKFSATNIFDNNKYYVYATDGSFWAPNEWTTFPAWQATGQDTHSTVVQAPRR
jgi:parallel beta-helix repeat protein